MKPRANVPWKACHGWKSRPRNYSGFLIYYLNSNVRESGNFCLWNPESRKKIPEESRILGFGIRNPTNDWNAESKSHWQKIRNPVPRVRNLCLGTVLDYLTRGDQQTRRYVHTKTHVCTVKLYYRNKDTKTSRVPVTCKVGNQLWNQQYSIVRISYLSPQIFGYFNDNFFEPFML